VPSSKVRLDVPLFSRIPPSRAMLLGGARCRPSWIGSRRSPVLAPTSSDDGTRRCFDPSPPSARSVWTAAGGKGCKAKMLGHHPFSPSLDGPTHSALRPEAFLQ